MRVSKAASQATPHCHSTTPTDQPCPSSRRMEAMAATQGVYSRLNTSRQPAESVVSVMEVLFPGGVSGALSPLAAASLLVFSLLYTPCVAAIASIRRELGRGWAVGVVFWQCAIAWIGALLVRLVGLLLGLG